MARLGAIEVLANPAPTAPAVPAAAPRRGPVASFVETTKPGITRLVTITAMVGFVMAVASRIAAAESGSVAWGDLVWGFIATVVGTALSAAGANAVNQYIERHRDAKMPRTARRALPEGRVSPHAVLWGGVTLSVLGPALLWALVGPVPAAVAAACVLSYVAVYTPLKTRTTLATFVGAIPGGLPPLIGWSAAAGASEWGTLTQWGGVSLLMLMLIWQIPHFLAIAWMYKDDYAQGGYVMLPLVDPQGRATSLTILLWSAALLPATILPATVMPEALGVATMGTALLSGLVFLLLAARLAKTRRREDARTVFFASIAHLPLLLVVMVGEALVRAVVR